MARILYKDPVDTVRGALDSVKEGQANRARLVSRWRCLGEKSFSADGRKLHELYLMHMHDGAWSEGATRNREIIKAAQRMAHEIERDPVRREEWVVRYTLYRASLPAEARYYHFYNFVYVTLYRMLKEDDLSSR